MMSKESRYTRNTKSGCNSLTVDESQNIEHVQNREDQFLTWSAGTTFFIINAWLKMALRGKGKALIKRYMIGDELTVGGWSSMRNLNKLSQKYKQVHLVDES